MNTAKLISKKRPGHHGQVYVAIDFETYNVDTWWTFGVVVTTYPEGNIVETFEIGVDRTREEISCPSIREFWQQHPEAFQQNAKLGTIHSDVDEAERRIADYVDTLKERFQDFFLISDAPAFDVRLLDNLLARQNRPAMCFRPNGYLQCLCVWSHRLAAMQLLNIRTADIQRLHANCRQPLREIDTHGSTSSNHRKVLRHTPCADAIGITQNYFWIKDIVAMHRKQQRH